MRLSAKSSFINLALACAALVFGVASGAHARTLEQVKALGTISICANPDALPFASSKEGGPPGFQIELARAIASGLGVQLNVDWILPRRRANVVNCDMMLDTVNESSAYEGRLLLSKPYQKTGIALGLRADAPAISGFADLQKGQKIGVMVSSLSSVVLGQRGISTSPYAFQSDMFDDIVNGELYGGAVSPALFSYYLKQHPEAKLKIVDAYKVDPELSWTVSVGLRKSDRALVDAVNSVLDQLLADGTITAIYQRYGLEHQAP